MSMTRKEGLKILKLVSDLFEIEFDENKGNAWLDILMQKGDYEETVKNIKRRAVDGSRFKPRISEIVIKPVKKNDFYKNYDETKTHAYKKKNDKQYAQVIKKFEMLRDKLQKEVEADEEQRI